METDRTMDSDTCIISQAEPEIQDAQNLFQRAIKVLQQRRQVVEEAQQQATNGVELGNLETMHD